MEIIIVCVLFVIIIILKREKFFKVYCLNGSGIGILMY